MELIAGSPEWLALRRTGIGGSDIGKILGVSKFGGPMTVFMEKRALSAPLIETEAMHFGKVLEDVVAREYAARSGRKVRRAAGFIRRPGYDWAYANVDRWSDQPGTKRRVLEVKTAGVFGASDFGEPGTDQVPGDYLTQVQWYLACTGKDEADLAVLIGGQKFGQYEIPRDDELIDGMTEIAAKFWSDTQAGRPPDIDGSEGSALYLASKYRDTGTERPMDERLALLATQYAALKADVKAREAEIDLVGNQIRDAMGDDRWAEGSGVRVVYGERAGRTTVDWKAIANLTAYPESVVKEFTTVGEPTRALTVSMRGDI